MKWINYTNAGGAVERRHNDHFSAAGRRGRRGYAAYARLIVIVDSSTVTSRIVKLPAPVNGIQNGLTGDKLQHQIVLRSSL